MAFSIRSSGLAGSLSEKRMYGLGAETPGTLHIGVQGKQGEPGRDGAQGPPGKSGVWVGSNEPNDRDYTVWIDPYGRTSDIEPSDEDIPKVFFGAALPQTKDDTVMSFRYISKTADISGYCKTKAQGSSSMSYPKKNQTVKLYKDAECTEKLKVDFKGWGKQNKFCFKANWIDLTHARNIVSARLWGDVVQSRANYAELPELLRTSPNQGAVDGFPVKVYAGGVYQGRYTINIPKDAWMANMNDELDSHCILCGESNADDRTLFRAESSIDGSDWSDEVHDTVPESIKARWNEGIRFAMNSTDEEFISGIGNYFDVDSLIDYYLFGLASCGLDAFGKNHLFMTYDGQKWYATMYDMDSTWGLWWDGTYFVSAGYPRSDYQDFKDGNGNLLYIRLASLFSDKILNRWLVLRNGALTVDNIINRFERFTDIAPPYLVAEDYAESTADGAFVAIPSVTTNNIQQIRRYVTERLHYCDDFMNGTEIITGYSILEYIESNGSQYIDTGISGGANASYEIKMADTGSETWDTFIGGANGNNAAKIQHTGSNVIASIPSNSSGWFTLWDAGDTATHVVRYERTASCYVDGREIDYGSSTEQFAGLGWGDLTWYVFSSHAETWTAANMRLYYLKMYTDGVLVRDFVPVKRNADGVYGLYDNVSKTFFAGSGTFTGQEKVVEMMV